VASVSVTEKNTPETAHRKVEQRKLGVSWKDKVRNEEARTRQHGTAENETYYQRKKD